jgi:hypothetical protein
VVREAQLLARGMGLSEQEAVKEVAEALEESTS